MPWVCSLAAVSCLKLKVKTGRWAPNLLPESPEEVMICHLFSPHSQEKLCTGTHHKLELNSLVWFQLCPALPSAELLCGSGPCSCSASFNPFACGSFCSSPFTLRALLRCNENEECEILMHFIYVPSSQVYLLAPGAGVCSGCDSEHFSQIFN